MESLQSCGAELVSLPVVSLDVVQSRSGDGSVTALDVRRAVEFQAGAVPHALNIAHTRLATRLDELSKDSELLVYCRTGARATAAASYLEGRGFSVKVVQENFPDWWAGQGAPQADAALSA